MPSCADQQSHSAVTQNASRVFDHQLRPVRAARGRAIYDWFRKDADERQRRGFIAGRQGHIDDVLDPCAGAERQSPRTAGAPRTRRST